MHILSFRTLYSESNHDFYLRQINKFKFDLINDVLKKNLTEEKRVMISHTSEYSLRYIDSVFTHMSTTKSWLFNLNWFHV